MPHRLTSVNWPELPAEWTESILPVELPSLAVEIVSAIRAGVPEYRRALDGPYATATRRGVEQALNTFATQLIDGSSSSESDEVFRALGRLEAQEGRPHDVLAAAYRIGSLVAWRRLTTLIEKWPISANVVAALAEALFAFMDRLAGLSAQGYQQAQGRRATCMERQRSRLIKMLMDQPATPIDAIASLSDRTGWDLPQEIQALVIRDMKSVDARMFGASVLLSDESQSRIVLTAPAHVSDFLETLFDLEGVDSPVTVTVGSAVAVREAPRSLQLAQLASRLRQEHVLPHQRLTVCDDHLPTLMIMGDPQMAQLLIERRLQPLLSLTPSKRLRYGSLLSEWLERGGSQADLAGAIGLNRQTAHYQIGRLTEMFAADLRNATARVELILALRAALPRWRLDHP